jgi:hypothetical protein
MAVYHESFDTVLAIAFEQSKAGAYNHDQFLASSINKVTRTALPTPLLSLP